MSDIDNVFEAAKANPKDSVTIQALADALEERGASVESVRALTIDGPTVLLIGIPSEALTKATVDHIKDLFAGVMGRLTNHQVEIVVVPAELSIRVIKGQLRQQT